MSEMTDQAPLPSRWDPDGYPLRRELSFVPPETLFELLKDALAAGAAVGDLPKLGALIGGVHFFRVVRSREIPGPHEPTRDRDRAERGGAMIVFVLVLIVGTIVVANTNLGLLIANANLGLLVAAAVLLGLVMLALFRWYRGPALPAGGRMGCLRCGYDLGAAHKVGTDVEMNDAVYRLCRCPECGLLWPSHVSTVERRDLPVTMLDRTPIDAAEIRIAVVEVRMALAAAERGRGQG